MLKPGDLLKDEGSDWVGFVLRYDGGEGCILRRPNGKEERWCKTTDEQKEFGYYKQEIHTVADMLKALQCLPQDAHISVIDGNNSGPPAISLRKDAAHGEGGPWDVVDIYLGR